MLGHDWQPAEGTVVDDDWNASREKWIMDVRPIDGSAPFRAEVPHPGMDEDFRGPNRGQTVKLHADSKRQKAKFDTKDPQLSWKAHRQAERNRLQAELNAPPGSGALPFNAFEVGATTFQVAAGVDAAPLLNAVLSGNPQDRIAALKALRDARHQQMGGQQPMGGQSGAPFTQPPQSAPPFGSADPGAPSPARFAADPGPAAFGAGPQPASFGAPFAGGPTAESGADLAGRIAKLQTLLDQGLINHAEFSTQRQRIIDSI
jgi:hypothetical protein